MIPEQKEISNEIISIPRRFSISYKIIGILFVIITIHMLIVLLSAPLGIRSLSYIFYIFVNHPNNFWKFRYFKVPIFTLINNDLWIL